MMVPLGAYAAGDRIWSALALATIEHPAAPVPQRTQGTRSGNQEIFGYNSLYLLGEKKRELFLWAAKNG